MKWLLNRLREKSTWLGIFTLLGVLGMRINPELQELMTQAILAMAAIVAFVFRETTLERSDDVQPQAALPPIEFLGHPERYAPPAAGPLESQYQAPVAGTHPDRNRRATDPWVCDPVPSETGFKHPTARSAGAVGWNDDA